MTGNEGESGRLSGKRAETRRQNKGQIKGWGHVQDEFRAG